MKISKLGLVLALVTLFFSFGCARSYQSALNPDVFENWEVKEKKLNKKMFVSGGDMQVGVFRALENPDSEAEIVHAGTMTKITLNTDGSVAEELISYGYIDSGVVYVFEKNGNNFELVHTKKFLPGEGIIKKIE